MAKKMSKKSAQLTRTAVQPRAAEPVKLLSGGNPQVAKGDGDAPVQAYIAAMPGWKRDVGRRLDALIVRTIPGARKAVRWNSPFYGVEGLGWFLSYHCFTKYLKVTFFQGASLSPVPPGESKHKDVRYLDIHEGDTLDEELMASWIRQASELPGWGPVGAPNHPPVRHAVADVTAPRSLSVIHQTGPVAVSSRTSPTDQPARCRRARDSSGVG